MERKVTCFNRDRKGKCLAYNKEECSWECQARVANVDDKIKLLQSLLSRVNSQKEKRNLESELRAATEVKRAQLEGKMASWMSCYMADLHRGGGGGSSEGDSNRATAMKQLLKDNRAVKPTKEQTAEYKERLAEFEEAHGKLEKLGRTGISHSKIDSYTSHPYCFIDDGFGTCKGVRSGSGDIVSDCKKCSYLKD